MHNYHYDISKLGGQAYVLDVEGTWRELTAVVNNLAANLTNQVRSIAKVTKAVAVGDLSQQIEVDAQGEILELKKTRTNAKRELSYRWHRSFIQAMLYRSIEGA